MFKFKPGTKVRWRALGSDEEGSAGEGIVERAASDAEFSSIPAYRCYIVRATKPQAMADRLYYIYQDWLEAVAQAPEKEHICSCDMQLLMMRGCQCGGN